MANYVGYESATVEDLWLRILECWEVMNNNSFVWTSIYASERAIMNLEGDSITHIVSDVLNYVIFYTILATVDDFLLFLFLLVLIL